MRSERHADLSRVVCEALPDLVLHGTGGGETDGRSGLVRMLAACARAAGAEWGVWIPDGGLPLRASNTTAESTGHDPRVSRGLDWNVIRHVEPGAIVRLDHDALMRSPRWASWCGAAQGDGVRCRLVVARSGLTDDGHSGALGLWFESLRGISDEDVHELTQLVASVDTLVRRDRRRMEEQALLKVGQRATHLAHDLRHLLTLARLTLERERDAAPELARELGHQLSVASDLCAGALSDARQGGQETAVEVELLRALHDAARTASAVAGRDDVRVCVRCPEGTKVRAASSLLRRLLVNLTVNAVEATRPSGTVRLQVERVAESELVVRVTDEGRGMSLGERARLFGRARGTSEAGQRAAATRGFGLESVQAGLDELGAEARVTSTGAGTTVELSLVAADQSDSPSGDYVVVIDPDPARHASWGRESDVFIALRVVRTPREALRLLQTAVCAPQAVALVRGTTGVGLERLAQFARRQAVPCFVLDEARPEGLLERVRDALEPAPT